MGWGHSKKTRQQMKHKYYSGTPEMKHDQKIRWSDEIKKVTGVNWMAKALDTKHWENLKDIHTK